MSDTITVASTTDPQSAVTAAAAGEIYSEAHEPVPAEGPPTAVRSTTDSAKNVAEVEKEMVEAKQEKAAEYLGQSRRKLVRQVQRLSEKLARYEREETPAQAMDEPETAPAAPVAEDERGAFRQDVRPPEMPPPGTPQQSNEQFVQEYQYKQTLLPQKAEEAKSRIPDLVEKLAQLDRESPVSVLASLHIRQLENPFDIAVWLADHPAAVARLWALEGSGRGPDVIGELNRISANLADRHYHEPSESRGRGRSSTSAPAPIRPLGGGSSNGSRQRLDEMSYQDFKRARNAEERDRR